MCAGHVHTALLAGSGKGVEGWFPLQRVNVVADHPYHAQMDDAVLIDFVNPGRGASARVSVELSTESARALVDAIQAALDERRHDHG